MKFFYEGINKFMYKHSFIKSCVYFASKFCPWMVAIFYSLFLLKIVIESQTGFYLLFIKIFAGICYGLGLSTWKMGLPFSGTVSDVVCDVVIVILLFISNRQNRMLEKMLL